MTLKHLTVGQHARIQGLDPNHPSSQRLAEMGLVPGEVIKFIGKAPFGEPFKIEVMHYELCLRASDAAAVTLEPLDRDEH